MKNKTNHIVYKVEMASPASIAGIREGDEIISVNDVEIVDIFDYRFTVLDEQLNIKIKRDDEIIEVHVEKEAEEDLGLEFENGLMDDYRSCKNKCIFCFIDQMPKGMRETLYFKDDDSRLSFLQGNYITLTNLSNEDVDRIIKYRMEPINISVQATNPDLRCKMLNNRFAGDTLTIIDRFYESEITMNGQIVLCKGINDGDELKRSIEDLSKYLPVMESVSVVPVGLTKYRDGLFPLEPFTKEDAIEVIDLIESYQKGFYEKYGLHFIHASDEWYILAGRDMPDESTYDGYLQLENGVGMTRLLHDEFVNAFESLRITGFKKRFMKSSECTIVTGRLAYPYMKKYADMVNAEYPKIKVNVVAIRNDFFGETITVSGLVTGRDLINQMKETEHAKRLLIPKNMLRADADVFLDDVTVDEVRETLQVDVDIVKSSGKELFMKMLNM